jgi:hypothetical protein
VQLGSLLGLTASRGRGLKEGSGEGLDVSLCGSGLLGRRRELILGGSLGLGGELGRELDKSNGLLLGSCLLGGSLLLGGGLSLGVGVGINLLLGLGVGVNFGLGVSLDLRLSVGVDLGVLKNDGRVMRRESDASQNVRKYRVHIM